MNVIIPHNVILKSWNSSSQTQHFPFDFVIPLPPPRLARLIVQRDKLGRIIHSETFDILSQTTS